MVCLTASVLQPFRFPTTFRYQYSEDNPSTISSPDKLPTWQFHSAVTKVYTPEHTAHCIEGCDSLLSAVVVVCHRPCDNVTSIPCKIYSVNGSWARHPALYLAKHGVWANRLDSLCHEDKVWGQQSSESHPASSGDYPEAYHQRSCGVEPELWKRKLVGVYLSLKGNGIPPLARAGVTAKVWRNLILRGVRFRIKAVSKEAW